MDEERIEQVVAKAVREVLGSDDSDLDMYEAKVSRLMDSVYGLLDELMDKNLMDDVSSAVAVGAALDALENAWQD